MPANMKQYQDIDHYISNYPLDIQRVLGKIRATIKQVAPQATEKISYGIPTFAQNGNLVHFAAYSGHIGFYPGSAPIAAFAKQLKAYDTSKGTIRFPLDQPIPYDLIKDITAYAVERNLAKSKRK